MPTLEIIDLDIAVKDRVILRDVNLELERGKVSVLMGPNASGKTSLAMAIVGNPMYRVLKGRILLEGEDILGLPIHERVKRGISIAYQSPPEIRGLKLYDLLNLLAERRGVRRKYVEEVLHLLNINSQLLNRDLYVGFSGGEKKRIEMVQILISRPKVAILDEPDSGVDVDSLKLISNAIRTLLREGTAVLLITHYRLILQEIPADPVYIAIKGRVKECDASIVQIIEKCGYGCIERGVCDVV
ncbi:MAG: Fe-S cluster assembly ATPase SufC [Thermoprotei archaeon]|nr:MAG: Fe-S cluster assembly ATPase SufC [Thermoprotei archaeon]